MGPCPLPSPLQQGRLESPARSRQSLWDLGGWAVLWIVDALNLILLCAQGNPKPMPEWVSAEHQWSFYAQPAGVVMSEGLALPLPRGTEDMWQINLSCDEYREALPARDLGARCGSLTLGPLSSSASYTLTSPRSSLARRLARELA